MRSQKLSSGKGRLLFTRVGASAGSSEGLLSVKWLVPLVPGILSLGMVVKAVWWSQAPCQSELCLPWQLEVGYVKG